ncbi:thioredoxin-disulfide reductase [Cerasicoccus arenae]|uniref:Thioredoxin reductase n=1 Tax=Cerasicoccus arenae TaxID=424488 RepID=A0A8J3DGF3_9BACT|nr:thioredoxin-disulfide reductase [Cerasicoccus arenae]MBK1858858.1 thioredoxin-disulfide reductase [Cerasicoccus arenae]GHB96089.1 thioredoxin reductase [Cerasicoccus arenae]
MENVIILGTGCAGLTAAIYTARANLEPLLIEGGQPGGQLTTTSEVENFPGFPEGIDGFMLMDNMRKQCTRFGTRFANDMIEKIEVIDGVKKLTAESGKVYEARTVIIATGARPRLLGIPGEQELWGGKGVTTCATCDGAFYRNMDVVVVGGGDTACEEALFLTRFCSKVTLLHRRDELRASKVMADRTLAHAKIDVVWDTVPEEVLADSDGMMHAVRVKNVKTGEVRELEAKGFFIAIGHIPNTTFASEILKLDDEGYIVSDHESGVHTEVDGLFVAGDCSDHVYRQAITAAGMGCRAAIEAERWLAEQPELAEA